MRVVKRLHGTVILTAAVALLAFSSPAMAEAKACEGISKKCGDAYDKTIGGSPYSCVKCKQALCKNGGKGGLAGTEITKTCTPKKSSTLEPPAGVRSGLKMAPVRGISTPPPGKIPMKKKPMKMQNK